MVAKFETPVRIKENSPSQSRWMAVLATTLCIMSGQSAIAQQVDDATMAAQRHLIGSPLDANTENQVPMNSADSAILDYDTALKVFQTTQQHSKAVKDWGERRTVTIPSGVDPNSVIQKELLKVPALVGAGEGLTPVSQAQEAPTPAPVTEGGWDWTSQTDKGNSAPAASIDMQGGNLSQPQVQAPQQNMTAAPSVTQNAQGSELGFQGGRTQTTNYSPASVSNARVAQANPAAQNAPAAVKADPVELYNQAVKFHLSGKLDEAIKAYQEALIANPTLSQAHCNLGLIFNQQHRYEEAIAEFRKALAINSKDAITYNGIGASLRAQKDLEGAIKNWSTAVSLDPRLATAHYNLGTAFELKKEFDQALEQYQEAVKNDGRLGEAYYRSGLILARNNRIDEAKTQLTKALEAGANAEYSADARQRLAALEKAGM